jgi:hypothetical protein
LDARELRQYNPRQYNSRNPIGSGGATNICEFRRRVLIGINILLTWPANCTQHPHLISCPSFHSLVVCTNIACERVILRPLWRFICTNISFERALLSLRVAREVGHVNIGQVPCTSDTSPSTCDSSCHLFRYIHRIPRRPTLSFGCSC